MALSIDVNDPKTQRIMATVLVPIVLLYAFFHFMIKPGIASLKEKKAEVVTMQRRVDEIKKSLELPAKLNLEKSQLEAKLAELDQLLPSEENVSLLLDQFTAVETESKVYMVGFEAAEKIEDASKPYRANRYRITVEGGFHQYSRFMSEVMSLPRILSISELMIQPNTTLDLTGQVQEGLEDQPRSLTIECILTSYVFTGIPADGS